jgi:hypothetical protein
VEKQLLQTRERNQIAGEQILYMTARKELHPTGLVLEALSAQVLRFVNQGKLHLLELTAACYRRGLTLQLLGGERSQGG